MPSIRKLLIDVAIMVGLGVVLALLGPFGTFAAPFAFRLGYWLALALAGYFLFLPAMRTASRAARRLDLPEPAMWAAACALACVPMSVVVWGAGALWRRSRIPSFDDAATLYGNVLVVSALACLVLWFASARRRPVTAPLAAAEPPTIIPPPADQLAPPFLDRLPPRLGRELIALEMEDHYVRAHTPAGSALILMRMRDAVSELGELDGAQVHRSWWVARAAVTGVRRDGRNLRLALAGGLEAPVARGTVAGLEQAGWF